MQSTYITRPALACAMLMVLTLGACADDDRTAAPTLPPPIVVEPPPPPPPPRAVVDFAEVTDAEVTAVQAETTYSDRANQAAMERINAHWLYARARKNSARFPQQYGPGTGAGVTVAVHDTGLDHTHPQFAGRVDSRSILTYPLAELPPGQTATILTGTEAESITAYPNRALDRNEERPTIVRRTDGEYRTLPTRGIIGTRINPDGSSTDFILTGDLSHGTAAGCLIACGRVSGFHQGLAYQANILVRAIQLGSSSGSFQPVSIDNPQAWTSYDVSSANETAWFIQNGADIVNGSFGIPGSIDDRDQIR